MNAVLTVTDETFDVEVLPELRPVIVDFWADWCGPCRSMSLLMEELAREHPEVKVVAINTDQNPGVAQQFQVTSLPTILVFEQGQVVAGFRGARTKLALLRALSEWVHHVTL